MVAVSTLRLQHRSGDTWVYDSLSDPRGLARLLGDRPRLQSVMQVTDQGVQPLRFHASGAGGAHASDVTFDWQHGSVSGKYNGVKIHFPLHAGVQDDLSVQVALMAKLLAGHVPDKLYLIDRHSIREYDYTRGGEKTMSTPLGPLRTVLYVSHAPGSPRTTRFWCAPSKGYLPMLVEHTLRGRIQWTMRILSLTRPLSPGPRAALR